MSEIFSSIPEIKFEGKDSTNPFAFKYYDAKKVIMGKTMEEHLPFAMAYPQVHNGGIRAVAIATPGITVFALSILVCPMIPASPPKNAISTS